MLGIQMQLQCIIMQLKVILSRLISLNFAY